MSFGNWKELKFLNGSIETTMEAVTMTKQIKVASYLRMSSDKQESSIPDQRRAVQKYADEHGYVIVKEYLDEGISGDNTQKRLAFQKMIAEAGSGDFECIICWSQDRFGRFDPLEAGYWIQPLRIAGIRLETVAEGRLDWDTFAGRILYTVAQEGKRAFLTDLSRNVTRGMLERAKTGLWLGGSAPYAYTVVDQRLVPGDPTKIKIVQWIFHTYAHTASSLHDLARQLNDKGTPSPAGKLRHKTAIHKILSRPAYVGDAAWNRRHYGKYHEVVSGGITACTGSRKKQPMSRPQEQWVVFKDRHEALIDRKTFDRVQERLLDNREHKTPKRGPGGGNFLFTRLLFCGNCGSPMHGMTQVQHKANGLRSYRYRQYVCSSYNSHGSASCQRNGIAEQPLVGAVVRRIQQDFLNPKNLEKLKQELRRQLEPKGKVESARSLQKQLDELDRKIDQGAERVLSAPEASVAVLTQKLEQWQDQRHDLKAQLDALVDARPAGNPEAAVNAALGHLTRLERLLDKCNPKLLKDVIGQMVAKVECWFDHVPYGKRKRCVLSRGKVHLRPDLLVNRDVPHAEACGLLYGGGDHASRTS